MRGLVYVVSGPSGVGKGTIVKKVLEKRDDLALSVSMTTREKREGEVHGESYFFVSYEEFIKNAENDDLIEYSRHFDNFYGTPKAHVEQLLSGGKDVILEIDVNGALNAKRMMGEAVLIMVLPPNKAALYKRLKARNETDETIALRVSRLKYELSHCEKYDYIIVNENLDDAVSDLLSIMRAEKLKTSRNFEFANKILEDIE